MAVSMAFTAWTLPAETLEERIHAPRRERSTRSSRHMVQVILPLIFIVLLLLQSSVLKN